MRAAVIVCRRELGAYFTSPQAYVFIVVFLALSAGLTFHMGGFFTRDQADLRSFFQFHPWLYLLLMPAFAMRLWAEERKSGTLEMLMTLPVSPAAAVLGKFAAAWLFAAIALILTVPLWITVNMLGTPDNGVILASYLGSWLMAGGFLVLGACASALTANQVVAFVLGAVLCFLFLLSGVDVVQASVRGWLAPALVDALAGSSFLTHFGAITKGVIDLRSIVYFTSLIGFGLVVNTAILALRRTS